MVACGYDARIEHIQLAHTTEATNNIVGQKAISNLK